MISEQLEEIHICINNMEARIKGEIKELRLEMINKITEITTNLIKDAIKPILEEFKEIRDNIKEDLKQ